MSEEKSFVETVYDKMTKEAFDEVYYTGTKAQLVIREKIKHITVERLTPDQRFDLRTMLERLKNTSIEWLKNLDREKDIIKNGLFPSFTKKNES